MAEPMGRYQVRPIEATSPLHAEGLHWKVVNTTLPTQPIIGAFMLQMDACRFARMCKDDWK